MSKEISSRCGRTICVFYDKDNKISKCGLFEDRKECSTSMSQHRKTANKAKKKDSRNWW